MVDAGSGGGSGISQEARDHFEAHCAAADAVLGGPEDTDARFEALCARHPDLAEELRRLRAVSKAVERLLPGVWSAADEGSIAGPAREALQQTVTRLGRRGDRAARLRRLDEIGRGGMGVVTRVWDDDLRRPLAMKVMSGQGARSAAGDAAGTRRLARFLDEAQITGQLDHPGIVPVHELGCDASGAVYYTMRLIRGTDLREVFRKVRAHEEGWSPVRALGVLLKVCETMSYAHSRGVLHRDLKPANIMVGEFGEAYVMDWGLARVVGQDDARDLRIRAEAPLAPVGTERSAARGSGADSPLLTMEGDVVGTPCYMAPEQASGQVDRLGARSDIYSIGAILYELISGERPFDPPSDRRSSKVVLEHLKSGPPAPLDRFSHAFPPELVAICEKAMARRPEDRYASMAALAADLRDHLEGRVVSAYESGRWARLRKWAARNRALAAALATSAVLLLGVTILSLLHAEERRVQVEAIRRSSRDAYEQRELFLVRSRISDFRERCEDERFAATSPEPLHRWWLAQARQLLFGRPTESAEGTGEPLGLAQIERMVESLTAGDGAAPRSDAEGEAAPYAREAELQHKRAELEWLERISGSRPWPDPAPAASIPDLPSDFDAKDLNNAVWAMVDPRRPRLGQETTALHLSEKSLAGAITPEQRWAFRDSLAWALARVGRFAEARRLRQSIVDEVEAAGKSPAAHLWDAAGEDMPDLEPWILDFEEGTADRRRRRLANEIAAMEAERAELRAARAEPEERHRLAQLRELRRELREIARRVELAARSVETPTAQERWRAATAAIAADPRYGGLIVGPQIDLLPIGADPDSGLWEFVHLPSGDEPARTAEGRLQMKDEDGMVFVLLPAGTVPRPHAAAPLPCHGFELEAFFLSKFEMTQAQWHRLAPRWPTEPWVLSTLQPKTKANWAESDELLRGVHDWICLPTEAQWRYAAAGGTTTLVWTGDDGASLDARENVTSDRHGMWFLARIGSHAANPFGLHDIQGNAIELCRDPYAPTAPLRGGDGERLAPFAEQRVALGFHLGSGRGWNEPWMPGVDAVDSNVLGSTDRNGSVGLRPARPLLR